MQTKEALLEKRSQIEKFSKLIGSCSGTVLAIRSDGTVISYGRDLDGRSNVDSWYGVEEVSCAIYHSTARRFDGSIDSTYFMPENDDAERCDNYGQFDIEDFPKSCKKVAATMQYTFVLTNSGRVMATRYKSPHNLPDPDNTYSRATSWYGIKDIVTGSSMNTIIGLREDGTVVAAGSNYYGMCNVQGWSNVEKIYANVSTAIGIRKDGTVVATKYIAPSDTYTPDESKHYYGQCEVSGWRDIVDIAQGLRHTVGLRSDGTVVATKYRRFPGGTYHGQCEVADWQDIVAISASGNLTVGLRYDGTVVAVGDNSNGQCDVSAWSDIVAIHATNDATYAIRSDGTMLSTDSSFIPNGLKSDGTSITGDKDEDYKLFGDASTFDSEREEAKRKLASGEAESERRTAMDTFLATFRSESYGKSDTYENPSKTESEDEGKRSIPMIVAGIASITIADFAPNVVLALALLGVGIFLIVSGAKKKKR
ncbi:MAG: hypothetical protein IKK70_05440 [Clostridia bacterium]|nr:hypothetical protein [Clostridia bacterium]